MNRYQLEVAEMDRRGKIVVRILSFVGVGALVVLALWSAGLPPNAWFRAAQDWMARLRSEPVQQSVSVLPPTATPDATTSATSSAGPAAQDGTDSSASHVPLPLFLLSTSPGRNLREGTAQIGTSTTNPQTYSAGALLANGAILAEIHSDFVILKRGERTARLAIFQLASNAPVKANNDLLSVGGRQESQPLRATNREVLTDYLRPSPLYDGETLRGYQVYPGQKLGVFAQMGLQAGDVITAINDTPFVDPEQALQMFRQLTDGVAVIATIERNKKTERITLDGALIAADREQSTSVRADSIAAAPPPT
jgi:hypothetical protein